MFQTSIQMQSGDVLEGDRIRELTTFIINKFAQENLSCEEAKVVLGRAKSIIGEYSKVQKINE